MLESVVSSEPTVVHDNLLSRYGILITPESQAPAEGSQPPEEVHNVTLVLRPATKENMLPEQVQNILDLDISGEDISGTSTGHRDA